MRLLPLESSLTQDDDNADDEGNAPRKDESPIGGLFRYLIDGDVLRCHVEGSISQGEAFWCNALRNLLLCGARLRNT
jgi:hypothetical protein